MITNGDMKGKSWNTFSRRTTHYLLIPNMCQHEPPNAPHTLKWPKILGLFWMQGHLSKRKIILANIGRAIYFELI